MHQPHITLSHKWDSSGFARLMTSFRWFVSSIETNLIGTARKTWVASQCHLWEITRRKFGLKWTECFTCYVLTCGSILLNPHVIQVQIAGFIEKKVGRRFPTVCIINSNKLPASSCKKYRPMTLQSRIASQKIHFCK